MKTKQMLLLAGAVLMLLSVAPDAMATHCERCRYYPVWGEWACITPPPLLGGHEFCSEGGTWCEESGEYCPPHGQASLASEFTVSSVTRLDELDRAASVASATLVAQTEIAPTLNH